MVPVRKFAKRSRMSRFFYWVALGSAWVILAGMGFVAYCAFTLPNTTQLFQEKSAAVITVLAMDGSIIAQRGPMVKSRPVRYDFIPDHIVQAVLAAEDRRFFSHVGVDWLGIARALVTNLMEGRVVQGGSTITQQLAKNLFLHRDRTLKRKVQELLLAFWLESRFTKKQIFMLYINRVYWGAGVYGLEAASWRYFDKPARQLTLPESALLAGLLTAPSYTAPSRNSKLAWTKAQIVIDDMVEAGFIDEETAVQAKRDKPLLAQTARDISSVNYFVDWIFSKLSTLVGNIPFTDVTIRTTLNPVLQHQAQKTIRERITKAGQSLKVEQAALVALSEFGEVRAMVGGVSYKKSQFNRAVQAKRQPGSAFKPLIYLTALEEGFSPSSLFVDAPLTIDGWTPRNYNKEYAGEVSMQEALARSLNTASVRLLRQLGVRKVIRLARRLGMTSPLNEDYSLALGTAEVFLMELTAAYVPMANGGKLAPAHGIVSIVSKAGKTLYRAPSFSKQQIIEKRHSATIMDMLRYTVTQGTGKNARLANTLVAGKTGTTQNFRDAWFIGMAKGLVMGVWTGNDNATPTQGIAGGSLPALLWRDVMQQATVQKERR